MARAARKPLRRRGVRAKSKAGSRRVAVVRAKSGSRAKAAAKAAEDAPRRRATDRAPDEKPGKARAVKARVAKATSRPAPAAAPLRERRRAAPGTATAHAEPASEAEAGVTGLTDEERIESAKYTPRRAARVFEEERFLFPQSYGINRLRLLVKDPEWLFAYWDVDPKALESLRADLGERASALSQLTLRVFEDRSGGASTFLVPQHARTWYIPTRSPGRRYRAEVGVILPSGEFRALAQSDSVPTPRGAGSSQKAKRRVRYDRIRVPGQDSALGALADAESLADRPWEPPLDAGAGPQEERPETPSRRGRTAERGGASDLHRR